MGKSSGKKSKKKQSAPISKPELNPDFIDLLKQEHPDRADQILSALKSETTVSVRINPAKFHNERVADDHFLRGVLATKASEHNELSNPVPKTDQTNNTFLQPVPWESNAFYLSDRPQFTLDPLLHAGSYYVQEASSMLIGATVRNQIGRASC